MTPAAKTKTMQTPRALGYLMPAEWEPHEAIWLSWPHDRESFPRLERVEQTFLKIISAIHVGEEVRLFVKDVSMERRVRSMLAAAAIDPTRVAFFVDDYADVWIRDYGPTFILNRRERKKAIVRWRFNAWGGKYDALKKDGLIPDAILRHFPSPTFVPEVVMEGGSFDVNGAGTLMTTEQCLLNKNRNPNLDRKAIERILGDQLGIKKVLWLKDGVAGDDTDGHIDDVARFVSRDTIVCALETDERDENFKVLRENWELLQDAADQDGRKLKIIALPMPGWVGDKEGRLPASYANFYIGNAVVLAPIFGHENDAKALDILRQRFPNRKVVGIRCNDLVHGLGAIHCASQQEPAV